MRIKLLDPQCALTKGYKDDCGWDLRSRLEITIKPMQTVKIPAGFCIEVPVGESGDIRPRSSSSLNGLLIHTPPIDPGYRGEVHIIVTNLNYYDFTISKYQRIAQLVMTKIDTGETVKYANELTEGERGEKGFGSSGV